MRLIRLVAYLVAHPGERRWSNLSWWFWDQVGWTQGGPTGLRFPRRWNPKGRPHEKAYAATRGGTAPVLDGISVATAMDPDEWPELRERFEEQGREAFRDRYGRDSDRDVVWVHEPARTEVDEETGLEYEAPEVWVLLVEGWRP